MDDEAPIYVPVSYLARYSEARSRAVSNGVFAYSLPVILRRVDADDAPLAVSVRWRQGDAPPAMRWRSLDGDLWRPLVGPEDTVLGPMADFEAAMRHMAEYAGQWDDYPFKVQAPGNAYDGCAEFGGRTPEQRGLRIRSDTRKAALDRAAAFAAGNLALIDGHLHMRSRPPVWAVGCLHPFAWMSPGHVRLVLPDRPLGGNWLATFPLDRRDDAVAFARANAAGPSARAGEQVVEHAAHVDLAAWDFPDTRADDLKRCFEAVENALRFTEMHRFGRRFLKAYGDLGALVDELGAGEPDPGLLAEAVEANRRVVDAADPAWVKHEPVIMDAVGILRGVEMRRVFEAERALSHDAEALAGFSP